MPDVLVSMGFFNLTKESGLIENKYFVVLQKKCDRDVLVGDKIVRTM